MSTNNSPVAGQLLSRPLGEGAEHNQVTDPAALQSLLTPRGGGQSFRGPALEEASELASRGTGSPGNLDGQKEYAAGEAAKRAAGVRRTGANQPWADELARITDQADALAGHGYDTKLQIDVETLPADGALQATHSRLQGRTEAIRAAVSQARLIPAEHDDAVNDEAEAAVTARRSGKPRNDKTVVPIGERLAEAYAELQADLADLAEIRRAFDDDLAPARERTRLAEVAGMAGAWAAGIEDARSAARAIDTAVRGYAASVASPPEGKQAPRVDLPTAIHDAREHLRKAVEAIDRLEGIEHPLVTGVVAFQDDFPTMSAADRRHIWRQGPDLAFTRLWALERAEEFAYTDYTIGITEFAMASRGSTTVTIPSAAQFATQQARNEEISVANGGKPSLPAR
jgi:hypothetical protein